MASGEGPSEVKRSFFGRPCYLFNPALRKEHDDTGCSHCKHYLTIDCPHLSEFMEEVDDLEVE